MTLEEFIHYLRLQGVKDDDQVAIAVDSKSSAAVLTMTFEELKKQFYEYRIY